MFFFSYLETRKYVRVWHNLFRVSRNEKTKQIAILWIDNLDFQKWKLLSYVNF